MEGLDDVQLAPEVLPYAGDIPREVDELLALRAEEPPVWGCRPRGERLAPLVPREEPVVVAELARDAGDDQLGGVEDVVAGVAAGHVWRNHELAVARCARQKLARRPLLVLVECCPAPAFRQGAGVDPDLREIGFPNITHGLRDLPLLVRGCSNIILYNNYVSIATYYYCFCRIFRLDACIL